MFGQLAVSNTNVLPAFYTLFIKAVQPFSNRSTTFLQPLRKPSLCEVPLHKGRSAEPVFLNTYLCLWAHRLCKK